VGRKRIFWVQLIHLIMNDFSAARLWPRQVRGPTARELRRDAIKDLQDGSVEEGPKPTFVSPAAK
jgi:hypothetical protein